MRRNSSWGIDPDAETDLKNWGVTLSAYFILSLWASNLFAYLDMISVTFVVFPIAFIAAFLSWRYDTPSPPLMYVLGIPLGLLGVSLGLINIFSERSDLNALAPATAILLLIILFGGTILGLGYLWGGTERRKCLRYLFTRL